MFSEDTEEFRVKKVQYFEQLTEALLAFSLRYQDYAPLDSGLDLQADSTAADSHGQ